MYHIRYYLYHIVVYCSVLFCILLYRIVWYYITLHYMTLHMLKYQMDSNGLKFEEISSDWKVQLGARLPKQFLNASFWSCSAQECHWYGRRCVRPSHSCSCVWHIATEIALEIIGICFLARQRLGKQFICLESVSVGGRSQDFWKTQPELIIQCEWFRLYLRMLLTGRLIS